MSNNMKVTYIEVIKGNHFNARGYIIPEGNTPHLVRCVLYHEGKELRTKLKINEIKIIEPIIN